ncbi:hypothetical protein CMZ84_15550 [Lysobacteraceae bacterium NML93-0399]|nr:hypothetical protein CMZ84_15550 [Xanthomonadaceae bacterium NML93-0399]
MAYFQFQPRWKEELVCSYAGGSFVLDMPMGITSVYMPTQAAWPAHAPPGLADKWSLLHEELSAWCASNSIPLYVTDPPYVG